MPSIAVKEEYNSNILFSANNIKPDFITYISPGVELIDRTERLSTDLLLRLDRLEYASNRDLSATNQAYNGKFRYMATPLLGVSAEAAYTRNANPTLTVSPTGIITTATPWEHTTTSLSSDYQLSELTGAVVSYSFGRDHYVNRQDLDDISHDINAGIVYDLGRYFPLMKARANVGYSYYSFQTSRTDNTTGMVGLTRDLDEKWSAAVDGGVRRTSSETSVSSLELAFDPSLGFYYSTVTDHRKNTGWGWVGDATLSYKGEFGNCDLSYVRDITPANGLNGAAERNSVTFSARYRPTYELSFSFASGYYLLKSKPAEFSVQGISKTTINFAPGMRYEFSKDIFAEATYEYQRVDDSIAHTNTHRHLVFGRLYFQHPFFE